MVESRDVTGAEDSKMSQPEAKQFNTAKFPTVTGRSMQGGMIEFDSDVQYQIIDVPAQPTSQFLQKRSQAMVKNKNETSLALKNKTV